MATVWRVAPGADRVQLNPAGRAELTFTVTNDGPVDDRAVLDVVPGDPAERPWFAVTEPQRLVPRGASVPFLVRLGVAAGAPPGTRSVQARVYSADSAPEESSVLSDRVVYDVPGTQPTAPSRKWWPWLIPAAILLLAALGVGLFLALRPGDTTAESSPSTTLALTEGQSPEPPTPQGPPPTQVPLPTPEPQPTAEQPPPPPAPAPVGNLVASPDNLSCFFVNGELQVGFYILLFDATPDEILSTVEVSARTDYGASFTARSTVSNDAQSNTALALPSSEYGRNHVVTISVDTAGEVPETNESDNTIQVNVNVPANPPEELACSGSRG